MRRLVFTKDANRECWHCAGCDWVFSPPEIRGKSMESLMEQFEKIRAIKFEGHICSEHRKKENL